MASAVSLKTIGDWRKEIHTPLATALAVSMDVTGRTGSEACKHAIILMAKSAAAITPPKRPSPKKNRKVMHDPRMGKGAGQYVDVYTQGRSKPSKLHKFRFDSGDLRGTWARAKQIGNNSGLAKRSWMWGLGKLGATNTGSPIPGTSSVSALRGAEINGYIKKNKLSYITKILPSGWESVVQRKATNLIMKQAEQKIERKFKADVRRKRRQQQRAISTFFKV